MYGQVKFPLTRLPKYLSIPRPSYIHVNTMSTANLLNASFESDDEDDNFNPAPADLSDAEEGEGEIQNAAPRRPVANDAEDEEDEDAEGEGDDTVAAQHDEDEEEDEDDDEEEEEITVRPLIHHVLTLLLSNCCYL
jgi:hypothetical protein